MKNKFRVPAELEEFLRKEKVYTKYMKHLDEDNVTCIDGAFIWEDTPEGHTFWNNLNDKYEEER